MDQLSDDVDSNFDALIDLLAFDDVQNIAVAGPSLGSSHNNGHTTRLRDAASGKLDFDKIHSMFAKQNLGAVSADDTEQTLQRETDPHDVLNRSGSSRSVSPLNQSCEPQQGLRVPPSDFPASLDCNVESRPQQTPKSLISNPESHSRFVSEPIGSYTGNDPSQRNPPNLRTLIVNPVACNHIELPTQANKIVTKHTATTSDKCETQYLAAQLQFGQMNDALSQATSEVGALREQYEKLRALVAERIPPSKNFHAKRPFAQSSVNHDTFSSQAQVSTTDPCSYLNDDISALSEYEAKKILAKLITSLRLTPHLIKTLSEDPDTASGLDSLFPSPNVVQDINSSMEFLASVDELVWKRSIPVNDAGPDPLYSRANIDALMQRLLLWEKSVRGPR